MSLNWLKSTLSSFSLSSYIYTEQSSDDTLPLDIDDISIVDETSPPKTDTEHKKTITNTSISVKGLENLGNTCFFNASVQALLACPKFVQYITILSRAHKENTLHSEFTPYEPLPTDNNHQNKNSDENKVFCELLLDLFLGTITSPKHLFSQLCAFHPTEFSSFTQSDAHESFNKMMEILEIEQLYISTESQSENIINNMFEFFDNITHDEKYEHKNEDNVNDIMHAKNPFDGLLGSMIECTICKHSNQSKQTSFTCLTLSLCDTAQNNIFSVKLIDRIAAFEIEEQIDGYRCIICEYKAIINEIMNKYNLNNDLHKDKKQMNEIEMMVLNEQYHEINDKLNKLLSNNKNGIKQQNGYKFNGYAHNNNNIISGKQRLKYRIDMSLNKEYRTTAKKKQFVSRYPDVLCIHLNRLQFGAKDGRYVSFNALLSLDNLDHDHAESYNNNINNAMFNENDYRLLSQYILMSVIVHHGNDTGGHYTTYKRKINMKIDNELEWKSLEDFQCIERNSEWYHISDQFVNKVTINQVLMCKAYMLFYQKNQFSFIK